MRDVLLGFLLLCCSFISHAQTKDSLKTYKIDEVSVVSTSLRFFTEEREHLILDTIVANRKYESGLDAVLQFSYPLIIKSYGSAGSLSSVCLRGSGTNHTSVQWNGFDINSLSLGSVDFSQISASLFDNIYVIKGASGAIAGSGSFGGMIGLDNQFLSNKGIAAQIKVEGGSFHTANLFAQLELGKQKWSYQAKAYKQFSENNFPYTDMYMAGKPVRELLHNQADQKGLMQSFYYELKQGWKINAGLWMYENKKNIPGIMGESGSGTATQLDNSLKSFAEIKHLGSKSVFSAKAAYFTEFQNYKDKNDLSDSVYIIDSDILSQRTEFQSYYRYFTSQQIHLELGGNYQHLELFSDNYSGLVNENRLNMHVNSKLLLNSWIIDLNIRKPVINHYKTPWLFSISGRYQSDNGFLSLRSNISNKFRIPTFNERFWNPGGDPDLLPESGWGGEFQMKLKPIAFSTNSKLLYSSTLFSNEINNWIQWVPGATYWAPVNYKKVWSRGLENRLEWQKQLNPYKIISRFNYDYTLTTNIEGKASIVGKILPYVPVHKAGLSVHLEYLNYYLSIHSVFYGNRFSTMDNAEIYEMDPVFLSNIYMGVSLKRRGTEHRFQFKIKNLFNNKYQYIRAYPMPGIAFYLSYELKIFTNS